MDTSICLFRVNSTHLRQKKKLEAKLAELEPYLNFVERIRLRVRQEEYQVKNLFLSRGKEHLHDE